MTVDLPSAIPVVDLSPFSSSSNADHRKKAAQDFTDACRRLGFVTVVGHGVSSKRLAEAFSWSKKLFDLSYEDKMKAPHPPCNIPHRGYSPPGLEKVYSKTEREQEEATKTGGKSLEKVKDFKESYEIGSEENLAQPNIWIPKPVLPGFQEFMTGFYWELTNVSRTIFQLIGEGLNLTEDEKKLIVHQHSGHNNQLRLLHYPPVPAEALETQIVARMPAHSDWSSFTLLFQDDCGGLELEDSHKPDTFIAAKPVPDSFVLNIGDMFQRMTNDTFISATHRVVLPPMTDNFTSNPSWKRTTPARYSIPFFVAPDDDAKVACLPSMVGDARPAHYEPVVFSEYGDWVSKYQYERGPADETRNGSEGLKV